MTTVVHGCATAKRKHGYWTYQREYFADGNFMMTYVYVEDVTSKLCRYTRRVIDPACADCKRESDAVYLSLGYHSARVGS